MERPIMRLALAITALLSATPAVAEDIPDSARLLQFFTNRCTAIATDPETVFRGSVQPLPADEKIVQGPGGLSADKSLLMHSENIQFTGKLTAVLYFGRIRTSGGTQEECIMTLNLSAIETPDPFNDMPDIIANEAESILGGPTNLYGGGAMDDGSIVTMHLWAVETAFPPPAQLRFSNSEKLASLSRIIRTPNMMQ